jgi:ribonuclease HI
MTTLCQTLRTYAETQSGAQRTLALVAAEWIEENPRAAKHPLLGDVIASAMGAAMFDGGSGSSSTRGYVGKPRTVLDFFRSGSTASISNTTPSLPPLVSAPSSPSSTFAPQRLRIYCDGACTNNGRRGAKAGWGASIQDSRTGEELEAVSKPVPYDESQTNQRAELLALAWSIRRAAREPAGADIYTDSEYALKCLTVWAPAWAKNGWQKARGGEVLHQDIIQPLWDEFKALRGKVTVQHVRAHTGASDIHSRGNQRADELATQGAAVGAGATAFSN